MKKEIAESFRKMLEEDKSMRIGVFALGIIVAKSDNDFSPEEYKTIKEYLSSANCPIDEGVREQLKKIIDNPPSFTKVEEDYLDNLSTEELKAIDSYVYQLILSDGVFSAGEKEFTKVTWQPFMQKHHLDSIIDIPA